MTTPQRPLRIMLADPPLKEERYTYYHPTMGILYLAGAIKASFPSTEVQCSYLQGFGTLREHLAAVDRFKPDIYGLSFKSPMARLAYKTIRAVKARFPSLPVIAGGSHVSALPDEVMAATPVDACFQGECEPTIVQLLQTMSGGVPQYEKLPGAVYRDGSAILRNPIGPFRTNLDEIPWPAWDLIDCRRFSGAFYRKSEPYLGVLVSRGCPFRCTFCSEPVWRIFGRSTYRARSPRGIAEEVEHHYGMGVREIRLWCEELNNDTEWLLDLMERIAALEHEDLVLSSDLRADNVTAALAAAMANARMWLVHVGMESSSNRTLRGIRKQVTTDQVESACTHLSNAGIRVLGYFQFYSAWEENGALCWETAEDADRTLDWIQNLNRRGILHYIASCVATPRLATPLWELATKYHLFKESPEEPFSYLREGMRLPGVSATQVRKTILRANYVKARMGLTSGNVNIRDIPFYLWRNIKRVARA
jgi:radical SAM superfamily enzyme YgiQ (UPF0313 family)